MPNPTFQPHSAREAESWETWLLRQSLERKFRSFTQSPLHKHSGLPRHVLCCCFCDFGARVLPCSSDGLQSQGPPAAISRSAGITRPQQRPFPMAVLAFLHSTVSLYPSQAGLKLKTFFHPIHPFNLTVCKRGRHLHTQSTHSGVLVCRWLGRLLLIQCEHPEVRGCSAVAHG